MPDKRFNRLIRCLRRMVGMEDERSSDRQLLARYFIAHDEDAFDVVLERHARMVLGVCRRVLGDEHEAEDAFQATFLVLATKGAAVREESVGGWLHEVARRVATRAKAHRLSCDKLEADMTTIHSVSEEERRELRAVLDEEIDRLPSKYRLPVVLCYLEGKTYEEASRELGLPKGTVSIRLTRAREMLRGRLLRRGLALSSVPFAASMSQAAATAAVPPTLLSATTKAVSLAAAGMAASTVSAHAASLAVDIVHSMFMAKVKTAMVALGVMLGAGALAAGAAFISYQTLVGSTEMQRPENLMSTPSEETGEKPAPSPSPTVSAGGEKENVVLPLDVQLTAKQREYKHEVQKMAEVLRKEGKTQTFPVPPVDLTLELRNTGKEPLKVRLGEEPSLPEDFEGPQPCFRIHLAPPGMEFDLQGPGAIVARSDLKDKIEITYREVELQPGQTCSVPIQSFMSYDLKDGKALCHLAYWTEAGEHLLKVRYRVAVSSPPKGSEDAGGGFGWIVLTSSPVKLTVR